MALMLAPASGRSVWDQALFRQSTGCILLYNSNSMSVIWRANSIGWMSASCNVLPAPTLGTIGGGATVDVVVIRRRRMSPSLCYKAEVSSHTLTTEKSLSTHPSLDSFYQLLAWHTDLGISCHNICSKLLYAFQNIGIQRFIVMLVQPCL